MTSTNVVPTMEDVKRCVKTLTAVTLVPASQAIHWMIHITIAQVRHEVLIYKTLDHADIDECGVSNGGCDHICTNIPGSYNCSCRSGFNVTSDGKGCTGIILKCRTFIIL